MGNFFFSQDVFYKFLELSAIFIPFDFVVGEIYRFGRV